jgi:hypothetical protein
VNAASADPLPPVEILTSAASASVFAYNIEAAAFELPPEVSYRVTARKYSAEAIVYPDDYGRIVVSFKGTAEARDWWTNLRAYPWKWAKGWSHRGFTVAARALCRDIMLVISMLDYDLKSEVIITGHSLGGAMAEKFAELFSDYHAKVHLVTFGKPNGQFLPKQSRLAYLSTQLSVVHGSDLVTRLPRVLFRPDPGQNMLYLSNNGENVCNPSGEYKRQDWEISDMIDDHNMGGYIIRLLNICEAELCETLH